MEELKIGSTLVYDLSYSGKAFQYNTVKIVGETSQSWIIETYTKNNKVSKKTLRRNIPNYGYEQYYTEEGWKLVKERESLIDNIKEKYRSFKWEKLDNDSLEQLYEILDRVDE